MLEEFEQELTAALQQIIDQAGLTEREREVIMRRWMQEGEGEWLNETAQGLGITKERIRAVEAKAKRKMQANMKQLSGIKDMQSGLRSELRALKARMQLLDDLTGNLMQR